MKNSFRISLFLLLTGFITLYLLYIFDVVDYVVFNSGAFALILNLVNSVAAKYAYDYTLGKSNKIFLIVVLGGMTSRLLFLLAAILILLMFLNIDKYAFILIFFMFYFVLLIFEIAQYKSKVGKTVINDES